MTDSVHTVAARPEAARRTSSHSAAWWVGTFAGAFLGCVLLVAVWAKAIDPAAFAEQIRAERLDLVLSAEAVALVALALETGLGLLLLLGVRRLWVLVPTTLLVAFFVFLTGRTWWLDSQGLLEEGANCGCFGNLVQRTPAEAFWQDLALLVPPLALAFLGRERSGRRFPPVRTGAAAVATLAVVAFAWKAPGLPLDDVATRLRPGVEVAGLCVAGEGTRVCMDTVIPELAQGEHLVVLADLEDEATGEAVAALNELAFAPGAPRVWMVTAATPEQHHAFYWRWGPAFEVREAPVPLLRPLYRRLPRSFGVEDGRVTRTHPGLPPGSEPTENDPLKRSAP